MEEKKQTSAVASRKPKQNLQFQREKDKEMVKGIFHYDEVPGGDLAFYYSKYKGDQPQRYKLKDGEVCTIPLGVAKHLNKDCWYPVHAHVVDANGKNAYKVGERKSRCHFQSLEFIDPEDFSSVDPNLVTVEKV